MKITVPRFRLFLQRTPQHLREVAALGVSLLLAGSTWAADAVGTLAGIAGSPGYVDNATSGTSVQFRFTVPSGAVSDGTYVYVADALNHAIRRVSVATGATAVFAGSASGLSGNVNANGTAARFSSPQGIAIDGAGNLYVADTGNNAIRMITPAGDVTTVAGPFPGTTGSGYANLAGTNARFNTPTGIAADRAGAGGAATALFVADSGNNAIRKVLISGGTTSTLAGSATGSAGSTDNVALLNALFSLPSGIAAANTAGTLFYVADTNNHRIRIVNVSTDLVTTLAGSGSASYVESSGTSASFNTPRGIAYNSTAGTVLVADTVNHVIRSINTSTTQTSLYAGTPGMSGTTNGLALNVARFQYPSGIAVGTNAVYVVDTANSTLRVIAAATAPSITTPPGNTTVSVGGTATFTVVASSTPTPAYQWQYSTNSGISWTNLTNGAISGGTVSGATSSQLSISGVTSALNNVQFRVVVSNGVADATSGVAALTVNQPPVITNTTTTFYATIGQPISGATITASGTPNPTFNDPVGSFPTTWASFDKSTGVISGTPLDATNSPFTFSLTATNSGGTSNPLTFTIIVQSGPAIVTQPSNQNVQVGQNATFSIVASGSPAPTGYRWQFSSNAGASWSDLNDGAFPGGGSITGATSSTLYISGVTLMMNGYQFRAVVTNSVGSSNSNPASLTVGQAPAITSISTTTFVANQSNTYALTATGSPAPQFTLIGAPSWVSIPLGTTTLVGTPTSDNVAGSPYIFTITASNTLGTSSQAFSLLVSATPLVPQITTQPQTQTVGLGEIATFTVVATGNPTPAYQWQRYRIGDTGYVNLADSSEYSGTTTATLTVNGVSTIHSGDLYQVVVSNIYGSATSSTVQLTVGLGTVFSTIAGQPGVRGSTDGVGSSALFNTPNAIAVDNIGNVYVADASNHVIRKMTSGGAVTTLAGLAGSSGTADGFGSTARFNTPSAVAVDTAGNVFVADAGNHIIRLITSTGVVTTIAGSPGISGSADGVGSLARFSFPSGIAVDASGFVYVGDLLNHTIRKLIPGGALTNYNVTTFAGSAGSSGSTDMVIGTNARFNFPAGVAVDSLGNVYVADSRNHTIRKISAGAYVTTLAGLVGNTGSINGTGSAARFNQPQGVAVDTSGNVYVADTFNHTIRRVTSIGDVTLVAGLAGTSGSANGSGTAARFAQPYGVAVDTSGNIYVADTFNHTIRRSGGTTAPSITAHPQNQTAMVGASATFTVTATGSPTPSFQWQRRPAASSDFVNLINDSTYGGVYTSTLTITNVTQEMNGDEFRVVANNLVEPSAMSNGAFLTVRPAVTAPSITTQPAGATLNRGETATFSVTAAGTAPLTYQWRKDGANITGASSASLVITNVQLANSGLYTVLISNEAGNVTSVPVSLYVNAPPSIVSQPRPQTALVGATVVFSTDVVSSPGTTFQWRRNGVAIPGATSASHAVIGVTAADAGNYALVATNSLGSVVSSLAQLTVVSSPTAPVITAQPTSRAVVVGGATTFSVGAMAAPAPSYQWRKDGSPIAGAVGSTLTISNAQPGDAALYDVVVTNTQGSVTSQGGALRVLARSYAGTYFGSFGGSLGTFALYIRDDNTGIFLGYLPGSVAPVMSTVVSVNDAGQFSFNQAAIAASQNPGEPARAAALAPVSVSGTIASNGNVSGSISGAVSTSLTATRSADVGAGQGVAGYYQAGSGTNAAVAYAIIGANGQAFVITQAGNVTDGGTGAVNSSGNVSVVTGRSTIGATIQPNTGVLTGSSSGAVSTVFTGGNESVLAAQRLLNISSRARVGAGENVGIAGFVIAGTESKPVLIRAVGPTLAQAPFSLTGVLSNPKLDLHRLPPGASAVLVATNSGIASDRAAIDAAGAQIGAFPLGSAGTDAAILTTLPPGNYTATVGSATTNTGVALIEVYDLSAASSGQKLLNISTRAGAGSAENTLIAGVVVSGYAPKRVLIRGVGPGLAAFGVTGVLAQPTLTLYNQAGTAIAANTNWTTSSDSVTLTSASASVGAFPLATGDSAIIVTLPPGNYTAQVTGAGTATGVALVELYELP